jgi:hypothetical protein
MALTNTDFKKLPQAGFHVLRIYSGLFDYSVSNTADGAPNERMNYNE